MSKNNVTMASGIEFSNLSKTVNLSPKVEPELVEFLNLMADMLDLSGQREVIHELLYQYSVSKSSVYQDILKEYQHRKKLQTQ